jgi:hypothetical protein
MGEESEDAQRQRRMDLDIFGYSFVYGRQSPKASTRNLDANDTIQCHFLVSPPDKKRSETNGMALDIGANILFSLSCMYSTMYASLAAFTRVSVPCTGSANESIITIEPPITLPCISPMISWGTPDRAWMTYMNMIRRLCSDIRRGRRGLTILMSATAEILHDLK